MKENLSDSIIRGLFELIFVALGSFGMQKTRGILRQIIFMLGGFKSILRKLLLCFILFNYSCSDEPYVLVEFSPVNYNLAEMPYDNLSEYNFFEGNMNCLLYTSTLPTNREV